MKSLVAYEKIRDLILTGKKLPGTHLVLSDLEKEMGIGRGPIREALMRLDRSGLVKNIPYKGAVVSHPPSQKEMAIIFNMRIELESQLTIEAMQYLTDEDLEQLEQLHEQMKKMNDDFYSLDRRFHRQIYMASNLPHLCTVVDKLIESVETFLTLYHQEISDCQKFANEHGEILEALKEKDEGKVSEALKNNIRSGLEVVQRSFSRLVAK
ncbi:MAG: GntR family transcriptional regulator [Desulforhabdus sp.]|nr:GntR family transcriptional regulator [Desulforhabdus sp.]